jgi:hypothetical protein
MAFAAVTCLLAGSAAWSSAAQAPVNNLPPEVVGNPQVGERLVCAAGSWSGPVSVFTYQWVQRGLVIGTGVSHRVTIADRGRSLSCVVTASGSEGSAEAQSANSLGIPGPEPESRPENTIAPEVSGTPAVGETLTCSQGGWSGNPSPALTYQWVRDTGAEETAIALATGSTHRVLSTDQGHLLGCRVTATNGAGSVSRLSSNRLRVPGTKPEVQAPPKVLGIEPSEVGATLTCSPGSWSETPAPVFTYRWLRDRGMPEETTIELATSGTYTVAAADELHSLSCEVIATNTMGSAEAASSNSVPVRGSKPQDTAAPEVLGNPALESTLTCDPGTWTGLPAPTYAYLWVRDEGTPAEEAIGSATASSYTVASEDRGRSLACEVTAANSEGSASQASEQVVVPAGGGGTAPQGGEAPTVSGQGALGASLNCSEGTWSGSPTPRIGYQWLRDGSTIAGATANTYVLAEADLGQTLSCRVTAINTEGVAFANSSNVLEVPGTAPEDIQVPQVFGTAAVGEPLSCSRGTWRGQPVPTFAYQWLRDGSGIPSATASGYTVTNDDRGRSISCRVTAQNSAGTLEAVSSNELEIPGNGPEDVEAPQVSGTPAVGETLTCSPGSWNAQPAPSYSYQWQLAGTDVPSATTDTYTVTNASRGLVLSCRVTANNGQGTQSAISKGVHVPGIGPRDIEAPQVSGTPAVGQSLTCLRGIWNGQPPPEFTYRWLRDGAIIPSATSSTYVVELADKGHLFACEVTATNGDGTAEAESSNGLAVLRGTVTPESRLESGLTTFANVSSTPTTAEILAALRAQLTRTQHHARISSLRKNGLYAFSFTSPGRGTLELFWYEVPTGARHSTKTKPVTLALSTTPFAGPKTNTVKLRLTGAGRRLVGHAGRITLTVKGVFLRAPERPVTYLATVVLGY